MAESCFFGAQSHERKSEIRISKFETNSNVQTEEKTKQYDLEERTFEFASNVREFMKSLPRTVTNEQDIRQLVRASGSVGANYIEANESLSKEDFVMRIKISRKEAKESRYWLRLLDTGDKQSLDKTRVAPIQEASELMNIFGSIVRGSE